MSNYTSTKAAINAAIKENGNNEITGPVLNTILTAMVNNLGDGYRFAGIVSPSSPAIETDNRVFVMATEVGTYTNFGGLTVSTGELAIFTYSTSWSKQAVTIATGPDAGKIDKVTTAVANDIAVFVAGGGLADSGTKLSDISAAIAAKYSKPSGGIPASDLASAVQTSLGKADTSVQPAGIADFVTRSVNDLANYYLKSETYTRSEVQNLIATIKQFTYEVVSVLPAASASTMNKIYLVPASSSVAQNVKDEYITIDNGSEASTRYTWEQIGSTSIDLSAYSTTAQMNAAINAHHDSTKQDVISDLASIRSGAALGATALQSVPNTYRTSAAQDVIDATKANLPHNPSDGEIVGVSIGTGGEVFLYGTGKYVDDFADAETTEGAISDLEDADEALGERIDDITPIGRYLSTWDCVEGEPGDEPVLPSGQTIYNYKTGDYYIISAVKPYPIVGENYNAIPVGATYTIGGFNAEDDMEEQEIEVGDMYRYDGAEWRLLRLHIKQLAWGNIGGTLSNQTDLNIALNAKYVKPASGIPSTDLASAVQTSLGKADSALQEHQSLAAYRTSAAQDTIDAGKLSNPSGGTTGQVLTKTATGEAWAGGGMTDEQEQIVSYALNRLDAGKVTFAQVVTYVSSLLSDIELIASSSLNDLETRKIVNNLAPEFHTWDGSYPIGTIRMCKGVLYRCTTATTASRPFTPSEWTRTTIMEEVIRLIQQ